MYIVKWCDQEGVQRERVFDSIKDACWARLDLNKYCDDVEIIDTETGRPVVL